MPKRDGSRFRDATTTGYVGAILDAAALLCQRRESRIGRPSAGSTHIFLISD